MQHSSAFKAPQSNTRSTPLLWCCSFEDCLNALWIFIRTRVFPCYYYSAIFTSIWDYKNKKQFITSAISKSKLVELQKPKCLVCLPLHEWKGQRLLWILCRRVFSFLRMIVTRSTVCSWRSSEAEERSSWQFTFLTLRDTSSHVSYAVSVFWNCRENISPASSARWRSRRWKQTAESTKQPQRRLDVLTEGVSFSSDLSLSPCSKNSLVTNSATWREKMQRCRATANKYFHYWFICQLFSQLMIY